MKTLCVRRLLTIMVVLCALHPAWAAWTSAVSMVLTVVLSDPSCASPSTRVGRLRRSRSGPNSDRESMERNQVGCLENHRWHRHLESQVVPQMVQATSFAGCGTLQVVFPQQFMTVQPGARSPALAVPLPQNLAALSSRWGMCSAWAAVLPVRVILRAFSTALSGAPSKPSPEQPSPRPVAAATVLAAWSAFPHRRPIRGMSLLRALPVLPGARSSISAAALAPVVTLLHATGRNPWPSDLFFPRQRRRAVPRTTIKAVPGRLRVGVGGADLAETSIPARRARKLRQGNSPAVRWPAMPGFGSSSFNGTSWSGWLKIGTATYNGNPGLRQH